MQQTYSAEHRAGEMLEREPARCVVRIEGVDGSSALGEVGGRGEPPPGGDVLASTGVDEWRAPEAGTGEEEEEEQSWHRLLL